MPFLMFTDHRTDKPINHYVSSFLCSDFDGTEMLTFISHQIAGSEKTRIMSRVGSASKMAASPSSRPTSSGDHSDYNRNSRLVSSSGRPSTAQRLHNSGGVENCGRSPPHSPASRNAPPGRSPGSGSGSRDNTTFRSLERLSISTSRRK